MSQRAPDPGFAGRARLLPQGRGRARAGRRGDRHHTAAGAIGAAGNGAGVVDHEIVTADASTTCAASNNGADRSSFDDVCDYNGLTYAGAQPFAPRSALSITPLAGLEAYQVKVDVRSQALNGVAAMRVTVTVTDITGQALTLDGYRANY